MGIKPSQNTGPEDQQLSLEDKKRFSNMVKFLSRAFVQTQTFGIEHPLAKKPIEQCFILMETLIREKGNFALYIAEKKLRYANTILEEKNPVVDRMIDLFSAVQIVSFEFENGFSKNDFHELLGIFSAKPEDIVAKGGVEKLIKEKKISHIKVNPIKYELIGMDEKVVSEEAKVSKEADIAQETLERLQEQLAKKKIEPRDKEAEEKREKNKLLNLIDDTLKEETEQSLFVDKLTANPLEVVNLITEAIQLMNKAGSDNARSIFSNIVNKLVLVGDTLYRCITENREEDKNVKQTYKAAGILGKELTERMKSMKITPELKDSAQEMKNVLVVLLDQIEAQKSLSGFFKGKVDSKKKARLLKKVIQHEKTSPEFGMLMKKLLTLKGMSEEEAGKLIDEKEKFLKTLKTEQETGVNQKLGVTLQELKDGKLDIEETIKKLKEAFKKSK